MVDMELNEYHGFIFDLDGVLWVGTQPIPGAAEAINALRDSGRKIAFLTNNASRHRKHHCEKLRSLGVKVDVSEIVTSGSAAAQVLKERHGPGRVYVMGTEKLKEEMTDAGHTLAEDKADYVVVGLDKEFDYRKLDIAFRNIYHYNSVFVACAETPTFLTEQGLHPGTGASVKALVYCTGKEPDLVTGKPYPTIMKIALQTIGLSANQVVMVGDVLEDDIRAAVDVGMETLFVLSGKNTRDDIERTKIVPTHILDSVADIRV